MLKDMLTPSDVHVGVVVDPAAKDAAIDVLAGLCQVSGAPVEELVRAFQKREEEDSTGFGGGVAIPHAKVEGDITPKVVVVRFAQPIDWDAIDGEPVTLAICLVMPAHDENNTHLQVISRFARKLVMADFVSGLMKATEPQALYDYIIQNVED